MTDANTAAPAAPEAPIAAAAAPESIESNEANESTENIDAKAGSPDKSSKPADKTPDAKAEKKSNKKTLKLKVDGDEIEESIDLDNEEELIKHLQLSKVSQKRMQEMAQLRKDADGLVQALMNDPEAVLRRLGKDPEDFAVKLLQKKIEEEQKSPEQKEREALQKELQELREKAKQEETSRQKAERERIEAEQERSIEEGMLAAIEKAGLPNKPLIVKRTAEVMLTAMDNNIDITPQEAMSIVKGELENDMKEYIAALPDEALEAFLSKDRLVGMRKKQVASIKKAAETASAIKPTGNDVLNKQKDEKPAKKITMSEFLRGSR